MIVKKFYFPYFNLFPYTIWQQILKKLRVTHNSECHICTSYKDNIELGNILTQLEPKVNKKAFSNRSKALNDGSILAKSQGITFLHYSAYV